MRKRVLKNKTKIKAWKKMVLFLPILLSLSWIFYLQYAQNSYIKYGYSGEFLAPPNIMPLMTALIIFTIGYILFLLLMFSENIEEFFWGLFRS